MNLLSAPDGSNRRQVYLPQGERELQGAYERRLAAARPSGFFRDAMRTYAGMLSHGSWLNLPSSLASVLTDVDGRGTDLAGIPCLGGPTGAAEQRCPGPVLPPEQS